MEPVHHVAVLLEAQIRHSLERDWRFNSADQEFPPTLKARHGPGAGDPLRRIMRKWRTWLSGMLTRAGRARNFAPWRLASSGTVGKRSGSRIHCKRSTWRVS